MNIRRVAFVGLLAVSLLSACQGTQSPVTGAVQPFSPPLNVGFQTVQDGWHCGDPFPKGQAIDRRNDLTLWNVGAFQNEPSYPGQLYLLAVTRRGGGDCRFFFIDDSIRYARFASPTVHPLDALATAPFAGVMQQRIEEATARCGANAGTDDATTAANACFDRISQSVAMSAAEVMSKRPVGGVLTGTSYLFLEGAVFGERGERF